MEAKLLSTHGQDVDLPGSTGLRRFRLWDQGTHGGTGFGGTTSDHAKLNHTCPTAALHVGDGCRALTLLKPRAHAPAANHMKQKHAAG